MSNPKLTTCLLTPELLHHSELVWLRWENPSGGLGRRLKGDEKSEMGPCVLGWK